MLFTFSFGPPQFTRIGHFFDGVWGTLPANPINSHKSMILRGFLQHLKSNMLVMVHKFEIFWSVISSISVYVMNIFSWKERSAYKLLHDDPMNSNGFAVFPDLLIPMSPLISIFSITLLRAKNTVVIRAIMNNEFRTTISAYKRFIVRPRFSGVVSKARTSPRTINLIGMAGREFHTAILTNLFHNGLQKVTAQPFYIALVEGAPSRMAGGDDITKNGKHPRQIYYTTEGR